MQCLHTFETIIIRIIGTNDRRIFDSSIHYSSTVKLSYKTRLQPDLIDELDDGDNKGARWLPLTIYLHRLFELSHTSLKHWNINIIIAGYCTFVCLAPDCLNYHTHLWVVAALTLMFFRGRNFYPHLTHTLSIIVLSSGETFDYTSQNRFRDGHIAYFRWNEKLDNFRRRK